MRLSLTRYLPGTPASVLMIVAAIIVTTGCRSVQKSPPATPPAGAVGAEGQPQQLTPGSGKLPEAAVGAEDGTGTPRDRNVEPATFRLNYPADNIDWLTGTHVVAVVNGAPVFASEILQRQHRALLTARDQMPLSQFRALQEDLIKKQLSGYVDRKLMAEALRNDLDADRQEFLDTQLEKIFIEQELPQLLQSHQVDSIIQLKQKLVREGLTLEVLKEDFQQQQAAMEYLRQKAQPRTTFAPTEMTAWYRQHLADFETTPRVRWRQILVTHKKQGGRQAARVVIDTVREKLEAGQDFADVAKVHSDGPAAGDGGQWDWTDRASFSDDRVEQALFETAKGTVSEVFEGAGFFQVVVATERKDGGPEKFEAVQSKIEEKLAERERLKEMERVVNDLKQAAQITTVFDRPGQPFLKKVTKLLPTAEPDRRPAADSTPKKARVIPEKE
ncbi:MAG: peptidylprolyl isomerase [Planctomycetaceae bacterium]